MIFTYGRSEKKESALAKVSEPQPSQVQRVPEKPQQNIKVAIDSIIEQYDVIKSGRYQQAMEAYKQAIRKEPPYTAASTNAYASAKLGDYEKAIDVCNKTIQKHRQYSKIFHVLGWVRAKLGNNDKALDACNSALKRDPYSAWVHYGLGRIYLILEKPEKAIESYRKAIQLQSDFPEAYLFLGLLYAELGEQKAKKLLEIINN